ncbi:hypothetical protein [Larkinella rosea]|uniref:Uncharacterized protein n=1 Tax=Larkinella rosea TaxID=2025312 RepID=A0A3P1BD38_9BACT|nr:hypothetical protein [Larkinella rosea]RRA99086.1 hypothetical protein EHT25_29360 [Larkinella rosea]
MVFHLTEFMAYSFSQPNATWDLCTPPVDIPTEETFQLYLLTLHYRTLEYENYSARFSPKQTTKIQWFATDMAKA